MTTAKERAREDFKRALLQTTRAISATRDAEVSFGGDHASVMQKTAKIPLPARVLDRDAAMIARGEADSAALHLAHHDSALHARLAPTGAEAQAVFRALETARIEAIGAKALKGVGDNLDASLNKTLADRRLDRLDPKEAGALPEVAALLLRQRLTGRDHPASAKALMKSPSLG